MSIEKKPPNTLKNNI